MLRCTCFALRVLVGIVGQVQCTLETAVGKFDTRKAASLFSLAPGAFTSHHRHVVFGRDLGVLFLNTGPVEGNPVLLIGFVNIQRQLQHA